jgi:hypothetical protein
MLPVAACGQAAKGWNSAGDKKITSCGFGTTPYRTMGGSGCPLKIAYGSIEAVQISQIKLK